MPAPRGAVKLRAGKPVPRIARLFARLFAWHPVRLDQEPTSEGLSRTRARFSPTRDFRLAPSPRPPGEVWSKPGEVAVS
jgi:hypothetical protein